MMVSLFTILLLSSFLFNLIYAVDQDIDLNLPASPAEEWPTAEMSRVSFIWQITFFLYIYDLV